jgi:hypothetical protein
LKGMNPNVSNYDGSAPTAESVRQTYRKGRAEDFVDEDGNVPPKGFYVVIGAFGVKENALNWKEKSIQEGDGETAILYNSSLQVREVYVYYDLSHDAAMAERMKRASKYPTVWVQKLE